MDIRKKFKIGDVVARNKAFMAKNTDVLNPERKVVGYDEGDGDYLLVETEAENRPRKAETMMVVERNGMRIGHLVLVGEVYSCWTAGVIEGFADDGMFYVSVKKGFGSEYCVVVFANPIRYQRELEGQPVPVGNWSDLLFCGITHADVKASHEEKIPCAAGAGIFNLNICEGSDKGNMIDKVCGDQENADVTISLGATYYLPTAMDKLISDIEKIGGTASVGEPLTSKWNGDLHSINGDGRLTGSEDDRLTGKQAYADLVDALAKYNAIAEEVKDAPQFKLVTK